MRELWVNIARTSGAKLYALLLGFVSITLTAHWLGPAGRGEYATAATWAGLFGTVGHLSLGQVALHRPEGDDVGGWLPELLGSLIVISTVVTVLGWLVAFVAYRATGGSLFGYVAKSTLCLGFALLPITMWGQYLSFLLSSTGELGAYNRMQICGQTVNVPLLLVLVVWLGEGVNGAMMASLVAQTLATGWALWKLVRVARPQLPPSRKAIRALLGGGLRLHAHSLGTFLFTTSDILIVQYYHGAKATGQYQLASQLFITLLLVPQAAALVVYAKIGALGPDAAWKHNKRISVQLTLVMAAIAVLAAIVAPLAITLVGGHEFAPAIRVLRILLPALVALTYSTLIGPQWISRGLFWQASLLSVTAGLLNVVGNLVLVPSFGIYAAAWTTVGSSILLAAVHVAMSMSLDKQYRLHVFGATHPATVVQR